MLPIKPAVLLFVANGRALGGVVKLLFTSEVRGRMTTRVASLLIGSIYGDPPTAASAAHHHPLSSGRCTHHKSVPCVDRDTHSHELG